MLRKAALLPLLAAFAVSACESSTEPGMARLSVLLTDAPSDYLESATVDIGAVTLRGADGTWTTVVEDGEVYDLLDLQNGVTALLGTVVIPAGTYTELRMVVQSATVTLLPDYQFEDGSQSMDLAVPSGASSGIKIALENADGAEEDGGVEINEETTLIVDFDVASNFVMLGSPESGIKGFNFTPRLRAVVEAVAASMAGLVFPVEAVTDTLTVEAAREGAPPEEAPATASVAVDGTWSMPFVAPGQYHVTLKRLAAGQAAGTVIVPVGESEAVTGVELIVDEP